MGACAGSDKNQSVVQIRRTLTETGVNNVPELQVEKVWTFLKKCKCDPVIGLRFKNVGRSRMEEMAKRISTMLDYAFKNDTIYPFEDLLKMHSMMAISKKELDTFCDLFLEECVVTGSTSVQVKILNRIKVFIMHRHKRMVNEANVIDFHQSLRTHPILKDRFMNMTPNRLDQITEKFISILNSDPCENDLIEMARVHKHLHISEVEYDEYVTLLNDKLVLDVTPILEMVKPHIVSKNGNTVMRLVHSMKANPILKKRFQKMQIWKLREMLWVVLELTKKLQWFDQIEQFSALHRHLKISAEEFDEFEKEISMVYPENEEFISRMKAIIAEMKNAI